VKAYRVRFLPLARQHLTEIYDFIAERSSPETAFGYITRIETFCRSLKDFPERGSPRDEIRPGLHVVAFERRVTVAFTAIAEDVRIIAILYGGRQLPD
jgi:toxin ParE1/3/4